MPVSRWLAMALIAWCATQASCKNDPPLDGGACPDVNADYPCSHAGDTCALATTCANGVSETGTCTCTDVAMCSSLFHADCTSDYRWQCLPARCCSNNPSCGTCTAATGCGWSFAQNRCLDGNPADTMSSDGTSSGLDWANSASSCPSTQCPVQPDCQACTLTAGCGWCLAQNTCLPSVGATSQDGTCAGSQWAPWLAACPSSAAMCATHGANCFECVSTAYCGMCEGTGMCVAGTASGPVSGAVQESCAGRWAWGASSCTGFDAGTAPDAGDAAAD